MALLTSKFFSCELPVCARGLHVAVVGSGPAGFYVTQHLIKRNDVHNVTNSFTKTAASPHVSFLGNVSVGTDITLQEMRQAFHVVVLCYGSARDRMLNIPGEDERNVLSARTFVGWYNGAPEDQNLDVDLNVDSAIIIGQGNVALDCARILTSPYALLRQTDITKQSLGKLSQSRISDVRLIGRRGPLQVAFTIKELREQTKIPNCQTLIDAKDLNSLTTAFLENLPRPRKRLTELMKSISELPAEPTDKKCRIQFLRSPLSISRTSSNKLAVEFAVNQLDDPLAEDSKVQSTKNREVIETGLVIKSIGYTTVPLDPSIPIDDKRGCILNEDGKIPGQGPGLYCSGWAATGPSGVLLGTMNGSFEVAKKILRDTDAGDIVVDERGGGEAVRQILAQRQVQVVTFDDWSKIDQVERETGQKEGKPREKLVSVREMVQTAQNGSCSKDQTAKDS